MSPYPVQTRIVGVRSPDVQQAGYVILRAREDNIKNGHFGELVAVNGNQINRPSYLVNISS